MIPAEARRTADGANPATRQPNYGERGRLRGQPYVGIQPDPPRSAEVREVRADHPPLASVDLDALVARADERYATLERERLVSGARALSAEPG